MKSRHSLCAAVNSVTPEDSGSNGVKAGKKGFTLIELLVVLGILAILLTLAIIAINPARQFSQANNIKRRSDILAILNAINQYMADNKGSLPGGTYGISSTSTKVIGTDTSGCNVTCGSTTTLSACLDLESVLAPTYIASMPFDPLKTNASNTAYAVVKSATNNRITITACSAELSESISLTR